MSYKYWSLINGNVTIGNNCFIGSGTIIREGLTIRDDTIIGAGKCVMGWPIIKYLIYEKYFNNS